jgi:hypothetical protein
MVFHKFTAFLKLNFTHLALLCDNLAILHRYFRKSRCQVMWRHINIAEILQPDATLPAETLKQGSPHRRESVGRASDNTLAIMTLGI